MSVFTVTWVLELYRDINTKIDWEKSEQ